MIRLNFQLLRLPQSQDYTQKRHPTRAVNPTNVPHHDRPLGCSQSPPLGRPMQQCRAQKKYYVQAHGDRPLTCWCTTAALCCRLRIILFRTFTRRDFSALVANNALVHIHNPTALVVVFFFKVASITITSRSRTLHTRLGTFFA